MIIVDVGQIVAWSWWVLLYYCWRYFGSHYYNCIMIQVLDVFLLVALWLLWFCCCGCYRYCIIMVVVDVVVITVVVFVVVIVVFSWLLLLLYY